METPAIVKPSGPLRRYVRYYWYWVLESRKRFAALTFPIGCPQIIFHRQTPLFIPELAVAQDRLTVSGQVNFPSHIAAGGDTDMVVAVFYPHTIGQFISTPPEKFYNTEISGYDLEDHSLNRLASQVFNCDDTRGCISLIEQWLMRRLARQSASHNLNRIGNAIKHMASNPSQTMESLARTACLSPRQFQRVFSRHVGMAPKEYSRIMRFQKSLWMLQNNHSDYAAIAYECGYSDQSHFIREFRQYSSLTPKSIINPYSDLFTDPT